MHAGCAQSQPLWLSSYLELGVVEVMIARRLDMKRAKPAVPFQRRNEQAFHHEPGNPQWHKRSQHGPRRKVNKRLEPVHAQAAPWVWVEALMVLLVHVFVQPTCVQHAVCPVEVTVPERQTTCTLHPVTHPLHTHAHAVTTCLQRWVRDCDSTAA